MSSATQQQNHQPDDNTTFIAKHVQDLLPIAAFLTAQQPVMKVSNNLGWISVQDVAVTLHYRSLLHEMQALQARRKSYLYLKPYFMGEEGSNSSSSENHNNDSTTEAATATTTTPWDEPLARVQKSLQAFGTSRVPRIHAYWQDVETLFTQILVTEDVRLQGNLYWNIPYAAEKDSLPSWGPLQPFWTSHVRELDQVHGDTVFRHLSTLPDADTWSCWAFGLSSSSSSSTLDTPRPATGDGTTEPLNDSPYGSIFLGQPLKSMQAQPRYIYSKGDLLALLHQSRHCSSSLRHLYQLFVVTRNNNNSNSEDSEDNNNTPYSVMLKGNHKHAYRHVRAHTPAVEDLVKHAIRQQMLVITPTVRSHLRHVWRTEKAKLHDQQQNDTTTTTTPGEPPAKRRKLTSSSSNVPELVLTIDDENDDSAVSLVFACQQVLLRTWARRHAAVLSPLFSTKPSPQHLDLLHVQEPSVSCTSNLKRAIKLAHKSDPSVDPADRSFDRIDRRLANKKYNDADQKVTKAVMDLLQAWKHVLTSQQESCKQENDDESNDGLAAAMEDWEAINERFDNTRATAGIAKAAASLLDEDASGAGILPDDVEAWRHVLSSCPAPWGRQCKLEASCDESLEETEMRSCAACEQWRHVACTKGHSVKVHSFCKAFSPLGRLFAVRPPDAPPVKAPMSWKRLEFVVERQRDENSDKLPPLGLKLFATAKAADFFRQFENYEVLAWDIPRHNGILPCNVGYPGFAILGFCDEESNPGKQAGMKEGDVITGMDMLTFDEEDTGGKVIVPRHYDFQDGSHLQEAAGAFSLPCTKIRFVVQRPDVGILHTADARWEAGKNTASLPLQVKEKRPELWFCGRCPAPAQGKDDSITESESQQMARLCRAVLRRLCTQPYAETFYYEDHVDAGSLGGSSGHKQCVSLRRLDLLLTAMIREQDLRENQGSPLYVRRERLSWIDETVNPHDHEVLDPRKVLCRGIDLMTSGESKHTADLNARQSMMADFAMYFSGWCLSASVDKTWHAFCPSFHLCSAFPWDRAHLCNICAMRHVEMPEQEVCDICQSANEVCELRLQRFDLALANYEERAAQVGSTVLLLPEDPTVQWMMQCLKEVNVQVEHFSRPVEFVVAAYIPFGLEKDSAFGLVDDEGCYFLLPVVNPTQLKFLTDRCLLGKSENLLTSETLQNWSNNGILDLNGVARLSYADLTSKLDSTRSIVSAIRSSILMMGRDQAIEVSVVETPVVETYTSTEVERAALKTKALESNRRLIVSCSGSPFFAQVFGRNTNITSLESLEDNELDFDWEVDKPLVPAETVRRYSVTGTFGDALMNEYVLAEMQAASCLLYTDLFFRTEEAKDAFESAHQVESDQHFSSWDVRTITLQHSPTNNGVARAFSNVGWGFELLGGTDGEPFVGRVDESGVAFRCGLRAGDKFLSISGKQPQCFVSCTAYIAAFTGSPLENLPHAKPALASLCALKESSTSKRIPGPLVLQIRRKHLASNEGATQQQVTRRGGDAYDESAEQHTSLGDNQYRNETQVASPSHEGREHFIEDAFANELLDVLLRRGALTQHSHVTTIQRVVAQSIRELRARGGTFYAPTPEHPDVQLSLNDEEATKLAFRALNVAYRERFAPQLQRNDLSPRDAGPLAPAPPLNPPAPMANGHQVPNLLAAQANYHAVNAFNAPANNQAAIPPVARANPHLAYPPRISQVNRTAQETIQINHRNAASFSTHSNRAGIAQVNQEFVHSNYRYLVDRIDLSAYQTHASFLRRSDLHVCGPGECSFTLAELAVLLKAIIEDRIMLGFRLLIPRYRIRNIETHLNYLTRMDIRKLRIVPEELWTPLIRQDYIRYEEEENGVNGRPKILVDPGTAYTVPDGQFPIDTLFEEYLNQLEPEVVMLDCPYRIRGGGRADEDRTLLTSTPMESWTGTLVYSRCTVDSKPQTIVGTVLSTSKDGQSVRIEVLIHMKQGAVDPYPVDDVAAESVFIAHEGSKYWTRVQNAKAFQRASHEAIEDAEAENEQDLTMETEPVSQVDIEEVLQHPFFRTIRMDDEERANELLRSIDVDNFPFVLLGYLPDWRSVYWHPLDRNAVYVSPIPSTESVVDFLGRLSSTEMPNSCQRGGRFHHVCNWCCSKTADAVQIFDRRQGLLNHYHDEHSACSDGFLSGLTRISSVEEMRKLFDALVGVVRRRFAKAEGLWRNDTDSQNGVDKFVVNVKSQEQEASVARRWTLATIAEKESLVTLVNIASIFTEKFQCRKLSFGEGESEQAELQATDTFSPPKQSLLFDRARRLILSIVETMPEMLVQKRFRCHICPEDGKDDRSVAPFSLVHLVKSSQSVPGLIHLFSFVTCCADHELFPEWWRSEGGGWKSAQPLLMNMSLPSLILSAQVFQEAISQAIRIAAEDDDTDFTVRTPRLPAKYVHLAKNITTEAKEKGIQVWQGGDEYYCYFCGEGGDLFCCTFCPKVLCKKCYHAGNVTEVPDNFVCHGCIVDIRDCDDPRN